MQSWEDVIHTAMIGTDKKILSVSQLPESLRAVQPILADKYGNDKETLYLQQASLLMNYKQCGLTLLQKEEIGSSMAQPEEKPYCPAVAAQVLKDVLNAEAPMLIDLWLRHCGEKEQIFPPAFIPVLFSKARQEKHLQKLIIRFSGKRGEWISGLNENWNFFHSENAEETWKTGTPEQRCTVLNETRKMDPALGLSWLQQTWATEDAAGKLGFLNVLKTGLNEGDIPFLESLHTEKSKKVKEEAIHLLKLLPGSSLNKLYQQVLSEAVQLKKERSLMGLSSKTFLQFKLPSSVPEAIFQSGIEKLSSQKNTSDEKFIIYQLISFTPPVFWEQHFQLKPMEIIDLFCKTEEGYEHTGAIGMAASRFPSPEWAALLITDENRLFIDLISQLPPDQKEKYLLKHFEKAGDTLIQLVANTGEEWSVPLAKTIFKYTSNKPDHFPKSYYRDHIHLIPAGMATELNRCTPVEQYPAMAWNKTCEYLLYLLDLKKQIHQSFNS
jgi:Family of unknown function (DUF5691)